MLQSVGIAFIFYEYSELLSKTTGTTTSMTVIKMKSQLVLNSTAGKQISLNSKNMTTWSDKNRDGWSHVP